MLQNGMLQGTVQVSNVAHRPLVLMEKLDRNIKLKVQALVKIALHAYLISYKIKLNQNLFVY